MTADDGIRLPPLVAGLCDDAAVFPPGCAPLPDAVRAYCDRRNTWSAGLVGPLVLPDDSIGDLARVVPPGAAVPLSVTFPGGPDGIEAVRAATAALPVELRAVEVAVAASADPVGAVDAIPDGLNGYVEIPRDDRGPAVLAAVASRGLRAKFRTGGVRAEFYPDEAELAASLAAVVRAGVPFKATAGLHYAVRNTDPDTGFEQHGFLNVLLATAVLLDGGGEADARTVLADRDGPALAGRLRELSSRQVTAARSAFTSFGTCSTTEPLAELIELGLVTALDRHGDTA